MRTWYINGLEGEAEPCVGLRVLAGASVNEGQVTQRMRSSCVSPGVERGDFSSAAALLVELHVRHAQADEASEHGLVELRALLEQRVLHHRRQLNETSDQPLNYMTQTPVSYCYT